MDKKLPVKVIEYRGVTVPIIFDESDQQFYGSIDGEIINFGYYNTNYEADVRFFIDKKLDTIYTFDLYPGTRLEWFFNGSDDHRDIRLVTGNRILKVFIVINNTNMTTITLNTIKNECLKFLKKIKNTHDFCV